MSRKLVKTALGRAGEHWITAELRARGHAVRWIGTLATSDLIIDRDIRAEVKTAYVTYVRVSGKIYPRWQFSFYRNAVRNGEQIYFLCCWPIHGEHPLATFIIPGDHLEPDRRKIDITTSDPFAYNGKWSHYRERWDLVETAIEAHRNGHRQLELGEPSVQSVVQ